jgi:HD-like signal output (HDOD) protein
MIARRLWEQLGRDPTISADDMYVAGLLHDAGLLVLEQHFPRECREVLRDRAASGGRLWQVEERHLGMDHGAVGGLLLGRWSLPAFIAEAVTNHHHPGQAEAQFQAVCHVVQAAEVLSYEAGAGLPEEGPPDCSSAELLSELGASANVIAALQGEIPRLAEKARQFLA